MGFGVRDRTSDWIRRLRGRQAKHEEVRLLRPVALAGASRRAGTASQLCNSFAVTAEPFADNFQYQYYDAPLGSDTSSSPSASSCSASSLTSSRSFARSTHRRKAMSDSTDVKLRECQMCGRRFVGCVSRFADYCSLDCKSASLLECPISV
ncbi:hypothetical protein PINS_up008633 [Pythium insidiosum]|nr:hypothetical protein PINS_up008633 [Pythium insidiosum]